jgi:hypothetical protein
MEASWYLFCVMKYVLVLYCNIACCVSKIRTQPLARVIHLMQ